MASMNELLPRSTLPDEPALRSWISDALANRAITRSQWEAVIAAFTPLLPATLSLAQRTPKGVLYVHAFDPLTARVTTYYLNHRARWVRRAPPAERPPAPRDTSYRITWDLV